MYNTTLRRVQFWVFTSASSISKALQATPAGRLVVELLEANIGWGNMTQTPIAMASNPRAMASNPRAMASNLRAMASNPRAMASNLRAMASNLIISDGLQPNSDGPPT